MILDGVHDHRALLALGATRVADITDEAGTVTGVEVSPAIDASGYQAALTASLNKRKAAEGIEACRAVAIACFEAGLPFPAEWRDYRKALLAIEATGTVAGDGPVEPAKPDGI